MQSNDMRSENAEIFNHDEWADGYDAVVANELQPIRAGYSQALNWLGSNVPGGSSVLDLGTGTGNTILALPEDCHIQAIDISAKMLAIAKSKLASRDVEYVIADLLEFIGRTPSIPQFDVVVSSYSIHHLTDIEKEVLFSHLRTTIKPGGRGVFADLMFRNQSERTAIMKKYRDIPDVYESIEEEFFWDLGVTERKLADMGFKVTTTRFSELSFGVLVEIPKT